MKFKALQRVVVNDPNGFFHGLTGTVIDYSESITERYLVFFDNSHIKKYLSSL